MEKIFLKDYKKPDFQISQTDLAFEINDTHTQVTSRLQFVKTNSQTDELILDGIDLELKSLKLNDQTLTPSDYVLTDKHLRILKVPGTFLLEVVTWIYPHKNTSLEGLYKSNALFCTQCEAQGFRKITYYLDRPDVMSSFKVSIKADKTKLPVLLSNGNLITKKDLANNQHEVIWEDPFKKPCYLFALVAGDLSLTKDQFITRSKRKVDLEIYTEKGFENRTQHALRSLQKAMKWDEEAFDREYDLDKYMIVASNDFNAGAMENKGLNIFNTRLVFASQDSATDNDYHMIESVVAHEYFHNWTGNRITLRDWFHLSLKEGLTVYRDQEFSADMTDSAVQRISDVQALREGQFLEDAGPNAHPVRPDSCYSVDNFFTATIYEKGAEVIRMIETLCGKEGFKKGMDLYFARHDGQAVTIEDFVKCFEETNQMDLTQFRKWYSEPKTPKLKVTDLYNEKARQYTLHIEVVSDHSMMIPLRMGLITADGQDSFGHRTLKIDKKSQSFVFDGVASQPTPSLNRNFGAPIHIEYDYTQEQLIHIAKNDVDGFNRWEAIQNLMLQIFREGISQGQVKLSTAFTQLLQSILQNKNLSESLKSVLLELPSDQILAQDQAVLNPELFFKIRESIKKQIGSQLEPALVSALKDGYASDSDLSFTAKGKRSLSSRILSYLCAHNDKYLQTVRDQYFQSQNMTLQSQALALLAQYETPARQEVLQDFYEKWQNDSLVLNKWFGIQAMAHHPKALDEIKKLTEHAKFNIKNPNNVYSLLRSYGAYNLSAFHKPESYKFYMDKVIEIDGFNPQVAARLAPGFGLWKKLPAGLQANVRSELERALKHNLSSNTFEILNKTLNS